MAKTPSYIETTGADELSASLEEATRSTDAGVKYFLEPAKGTLSRGKTRRHHLIFGRRGSGKSSLLNKLSHEFSLSRTPVAYVDLETFKGHSYPDVLVSILIKTLSSFDEWLNNAGVLPASKGSFWQTLFGQKPSEKSIDKRKAIALSSKVVKLRAELESLLFEPEESERNRTLSKSVSSAAEATVAIPADLNLAAKAGSGSETSRTITDHYKSHKIESLHRRILFFKEVFSEISAVSGKPSYLLLDDLYYIRPSDQAQVVDYFHRATKGTNTWLKIGTIRHRTQWYQFGSPPVGMKLGDDADEIDLDVTLERYDLTKDFLLKILDQFCKDHSIKLSSLLSDGARDRLVLASGGVARDYLSITRRSIDVTRQRLASDDRFRGIRISAEDANKASGELENFKFQDFERDVTAEEVEELKRSFERVRDFCVEKINCNCFLVNKDAKGSGVESEAYSSR